MIWLFLWKLLVFHGIPLLIFIHRHLQPPSDLASSGNRGGDLKESHLRRVKWKFFWIFLIMQAWGILGQELHYSINFLPYAVCLQFTMISYSNKLCFRTWTSWSWTTSWPPKMLTEDSSEQNRCCWNSMVFQYTISNECTTKKKTFPWSLKIIVFKISFLRGWFSGSMLNSRGLFGSLGHLMF